MALFLFCAFPLLLVITASASNNAFRFKACTAGLIAGIVVCAAEALFIFPTRDIRADFFPQFWLSYVELAASVLILAALFFLIFKGAVREKIRAFIFLFFSYFAVLIPYRIIAGVSAPGFFEYCIVPLLYAAAAADCAAAAAWFYISFAKTSRAPYPIRVAVLAVHSIVFLLAAALPRAAEISRISGGFSYMAAALAFLAFSVVFLIIFLLRDKFSQKH